MRKTRRPAPDAGKKQKPERGEYRAIYEVLLDSPEFLDLSSDARACLFPLKLKLGKSGIAPMYPETLQRYTAMGSERVSAGIDELCATNWLRVQGPVFWLRNGLRHDPLRLLAQPNQKTSIEQYLKTLPKLHIVNEFAQYYGLSIPFPDLKPSGSHPEPIGNPLNGNPSVPRNTEDGYTEDGKRNTDKYRDASLLPVQTSSSAVASIPAAAAAAAAEESEDDFVSKVIRLANRGMADSGIDFKPILTSHGSRQDVFDWLQAGIGREVIEHVVYERARDAGKQISSMAYFDGAVTDGWERTQSGKTPVPQRPTPGSEQAASYANSNGEKPKSNGARTGAMSGPLEPDWEMLADEWETQHPESAEELRRQVRREFEEKGVTSENWIRMHSPDRYQELVKERIRGW